MNEHPWQGHYHPDPPINPTSGIRNCTMNQIQQFRNISKNKWINEPRWIYDNDKEKTMFYRSAEFPKIPFAFYSVIARHGNVLILTPVFNEIVAHDRLDLRLVHMNKHARDTMNPGKFDPREYPIGIVICITRLHRKKRLKGLSIDGFIEKDVLKPGGKHYWEVSEYYGTPQHFARGKLTLPYQFKIGKHFCIAEEFSQIIEVPAPNELDISVNQLTSATFLVPSMKPGQFLSTLRGDHWLTVARMSPRFITFSSPVMLVNGTVDPEIERIFKNYDKVFSVWNRRDAYTALKVAIEFVSNGFSAMRNASFDTNRYTTRIVRYSTRHPYAFFSFTIFTGDCASLIAKWNRTVSIDLHCNENSKIFSANVMKARKTSRFTIKVKVRASLQSFDQSSFDDVRNQNVVVFQNRSFDASQIDFDVAEGSNADKLIQALYGGPPIPEVDLPKIDRIQIGRTTFHGTQAKYAQMVANKDVSALVGSCSFGCDKTTTIATAALYSSKCAASTQRQMITATTNSAVVAVIDKLVQLDPNVRVVRIITPIGASHVSPSELSRFDYPKLLTDLSLQEVFKEDDRLSPPHGQFPQGSPIPRKLLINMMSYLKNQSLLSKSMLKSDKLRTFYDQSTKCNDEELFKFYMKTKKPTIIIGAFQAIFNAFTSTCREYIKEIATIQIDEASTFPRETLLQLITLFPNARYALIGDYRQLTPYYESGASALMLDITIGETLRECVTKNLLPSVEFNVVFRCRPELTELLGDMFYNSSLQSSHRRCITEVQMKKCPALTLRKNNQYPIVFINTEDTKHRQVGKSLKNFQEANLAMNLARHLLHYVKKEDIAILCFYRAQINEMRVFGANEGIYVGSVASAQGREWPICIICTTRTNSHEKCKFLTNGNRINTALSRSKHVNFIFGHVKSMGDASYWGDIIDKCVEKETLVKSDKFNILLNYNIP